MRTRMPGVPWNASKEIFADLEATTTLQYCHTTFIA